MFFFSHFLAHQETKQRSHFTLVSNVSCSLFTLVLFFHRLRGCFMSVSGEPWDCWFESPGPPWMYEYDLYSQVKSPVTTLIRTRLRTVGLCFIWSLFFFFFLSNWNVFSRFQYFCRCLYKKQTNSSPRAQLQSAGIPHDDMLEEQPSGLMSYTWARCAGTVALMCWRKGYFQTGEFYLLSLQQLV